MARSCRSSTTPAASCGLDPRPESRPARRRRAAGPIRGCPPRAGGTGRRARRGPTLAMNRRTAASDQRRHVAEHVVADEVDDALALVRVASAAARGASSACSAPTASWPRNRPSAMVAGLPMSWRRAASRMYRAARSPRRPRPAACDPTGPRPGSCSGGCRAGPRARRRSARAGPCRPAAAARPTATGAARIRRSSSAIRSPDRWRDELGPGLDRGQRRRLDRRTRAWPRTGRRGASAARPPRTGRADRRRSAGPRAAMSARPPYGSTRCGARCERATGRRPPGDRVDREVATRQVELDRVA